MSVAAIVTQGFKFTPSLVVLQGFGAAEAGAGPTIDVQPANDSVTEPTAGSFTVEATTSGGTLHYQWKRQQPGAGSFSNVGTDSDTYSSGATEFDNDNGALIYVDVTDDGGTTSSDTVTLTVAGDGLGGGAGLVSNWHRRILLSRYAKQ